MTSVQVAPAAPTQRWNTLQVLKGTRIGLLALIGGLLLTIILGADEHRHAMQVVGNDTAPSIIAAQHIKAALADMDADLANDLLIPAGFANPSLGAYDERRVEGSEALIEAAKNITYDAEKAPIESVQVTTGTYERLAQQARDLEDEGQPDVSTRYYRAAGIIMDGTILPAADDLDKANNDVLEREYEQQSSRSLITRLFVGFLGLAALAALGAAQLYLTRRTRRTINPALFAATILTFGLTIYAFHGMSSEAHDLHVAREDAFTSIHALWQARALAFSANGSESRYLLDPLHASEYEAEFRKRTAANNLDSTGHPALGVKGFLANELDNITFPGEREAAVRTVAAFNRYMAIDGQIRQLEASGQHQQAIALDIGTSEGQSNWAFAQFDDALGATLKINKDAFDASVADGFSSVSGMEWKSAIAAVLIAVLIFLGLAPRIREYE